MNTITTISPPPHIYMNSKINTVHQFLQVLQQVSETRNSQVQHQTSDRIIITHLVPARRWHHANVLAVTSHRSLMGAITAHTMFYFSQAVLLRIVSTVCVMLGLNKYRQEGRKETFFYLTTHSTHFILQLYGVGHMVKDHSDSQRGNLLPPHRLLLSINSKGSFICTIPQTG